MQGCWRADADLKRRAAAATPLRCVGTTRDIVEACLFLLLDRASFITGTELVVEGGRMALPVMGARVAAGKLRRRGRRYIRG
jgi:NAD(P)-dependent dehydrogenase (short-subunit alcohol dehydrogenase family)